MARPSAFNLATASAIVQAKANGKDDASAAREAGISKSTLYGWLQRAEDGDPAFAAFAEAVRAAQNGHRDQQRRAILARFGVQATPTKDFAVAV